jgi:hypothetical protein
MYVHAYAHIPRHPHARTHRPKSSTYCFSMAKVICKHALVICTLLVLFVIVFILTKFSCVHHLLCYRILKLWFIKHVVVTVTVSFSSFRIRFARMSNSVSSDDAGNSCGETSSSLDSEKLAENLFWLIGGRRKGKSTKYKHSYEAIWVFKLRTRHEMKFDGFELLTEWVSCASSMYSCWKIEQHVLVYGKKHVYSMEIITHITLIAEY